MSAEPSSQGRPAGRSRRVPGQSSVPGARHETGSNHRKRHEGARRREVRPDHGCVRPADPLAAAAVVPARRPAPQVDELGVHREPHFEAALSHTPAQVDVLGVHEALLAKTTQVVPEGAAHEHDRAERRLNLPRRGVVPVHAPARLETVRDESGETRGAEERHTRRRQRHDRRVEGEVLPQQARHDDADVAPAEHADELGHAPGRVHERIPVHEQVRVSRQDLRAGVVTAREADVLRDPDERAAPQTSREPRASTDRMVRSGWPQLRTIAVSERSSRIRRAYRRISEGLKTCATSWQGTAGSVSASTTKERP